jgi:pyruvate dehydrogenase E1 component alpha subunit
MKKKINSIFKLIKKSRKFQIEINNLINQKKIQIPVHLGIGHEFVASLVRYFFKKNDQILLTHRNIHYTSIFSKNAKKNYLNFTINNLKKNNSRGSMNYTDRSSNIIYSSSILGNNYPVACGVAKSLSLKNSVVICVTGDGAIEEGTFYESLSLSKYLKLPIVFLIENNNWSMATSIKQRRIPISFKELSKSMNIRYFNFKKDDFIKNIKDYSNAINICRKNKSPIICEFEIETVGNIFKNKKKIHYHHGEMKIPYDKDYIIGNSKKDLIFKFKKIV